MSDHATHAPPFGYRAQSFEQFEAEVAPLLGASVKSTFRGRFVHEFVGVKPTRDWLLKGVFLARTFCLIVGAPGCGKSFLTLDLAMTMALAVVDDAAPKEWFGRKIKPSGVIYVAAEGQDDFIIRLHAWLISKGLPPSTKLPLYLIPTPIDLRSSDEGAKRLIAEVADVAKVMKAQWGCSPSVVFVDTFNRALAGGDDTRPDHVGALLKNCDTIREHTGAAVLAIHHTAKNSKTQDPRGHGSVRGDNDAEIFVADAEGAAPNSWTVSRAKGAPRGDKHEFRLRQLTVGRDEEGDPITSCIVAPGGMVGSQEANEMRDAADAAQTGKPTMTSDGRVILMTNALAAMRALNNLVKEAAKKVGVDDKGLPLREMPPPDVRVPFDAIAVKQEDWFEEIVRTMPGYVEGDAKHRDRCRKTRDSAAMKFSEKGLAGMDKGWIWRTKRRVAGIDRPEVDEFAPRRDTRSLADMGITDQDIDNLF